MKLTAAQIYHAKAILFDMDGTLVSSISLDENAWIGFARRHGVDHKVLLAKSHGRRTAETVAMFASEGSDIALETQRIQTEVSHMPDGLPSIAGVAQVLDTLPDSKWAVVTSADRKAAFQRIAAADLPAPPLLISAEDVVRGKPDPEGFLKAAKLLGVDIQDCVVFEDAPAGLRAAHAAGAQVIAVASLQSAENLAGENWITDYQSMVLEVLDDGSLKFHF